MSGTMIFAPSLKGGETRVADLRGWGYLTGRGHGALGLSEDQAIAAQNIVGRLLVAAPALADAAAPIVDILEDEERRLGDEPPYELGLMISRKDLRALRDALTLALRGRTG
ncbi:MAG: hypothetical protein ACYDD1_20900 [Caulobacteraceae bacterium]